MSGYFLYLNDIREQLKKENPKASVSDISKLAGTRWNNLDASAKVKYDKQHEAAKADYQKAKEDYETEHGPIKTTRKKRTNKDDSDGEEKKPRAKRDKKWFVENSSH